MKKSFKVILLLVSFAFVMGLAMTPGVSMASDEGAECLKIDTNGKGKHVENFPHKLHQHKYVKDGCEHCHHKAEGKKKDATGKDCKSCHKGKKDGGVPPMKSVAHKVCKGCHKGKKATHAGSSAKGKKLDACKTCHDAKRDCMK